MKLLKSLLLASALGVTGIALAQDASVTISSPADGAKVGTSAVKVAYSVVTGPKGDHVHFYVDDQEAAVLRQLKGTYTVDSLKAGTHTLCIRIVDKSHTPIGVEKCIKVTAG
ncbi:MAG: Ig-like domain-containing protein [Steroidobacteraceae bacterium]